MKLLVVLNPHARSGRAARLQPDIEAAFHAQGITTDITLTGATGQATAALMENLGNNEYDGVIAAGGDGTLFEVVNGLCRLPSKERPPLGHLPLGTGNAFARDLGLDPSEWRKGVELIARRRIRKVDVGRVQTAGASFHFINVLGWGFVVDAGLEALRFKFLGTGAYTMGVLSALFRLQTRSLHIELDGAVVEQENLFVTVSNSRYTGTHFLIAPNARLDDGLLDVTLVRRLTRRRLLRLFPTIFEGRHVAYEEVTTRQVRHIRVSEPAGLPLMADGEFRGSTPLEIHCLPGELRLFSAPRT